MRLRKWWKLLVERGSVVDFPMPSFEVAFADDLPIPANTFDAVVSRFGVMFFPSPVGSVREMLRVLKPGGRIAIAVWHFAERTRSITPCRKAVERYVNSSRTVAGVPMSQPRSV